MSLSHPDFPIFSFWTWMGGDRLVLMEIWREPLKSPPSTLVKSRQQNVGGSFYKIWRHDPYKLFKVICLDCIFNRTMLTFWERKNPTSASSSELLLSKKCNLFHPTPNATMCKYLGNIWSSSWNQIQKLWQFAGNGIWTQRGEVRKIREEEPRRKGREMKLLKHNRRGVLSERQILFSYFRGFSLFSWHTLNLSAKLSSCHCKYKSNP